MKYFSKKFFIITAFFNTGAFSVQACITCNKPMQSHIFNNDFLTYLALLSLPFVIVGFISIISYHLKSKNLNYTNRQGPLISTGIILGSGLGGFIDVILFHQILQWHDILSAVNAPDSLIRKQVNVFWDGLFHLFTLVFTIIGVLLLWNLFFYKG